MKLASLLVSALSAATALGATLDVWSPRVTNPVDGDTLIYNQVYNLTWDVSDAPSQITNNVAVAFLRQNDKTTQVILGGQTPIRQGSMMIYIPWVTSGAYEIVLMGDSGNFGPSINIVSPNPFRID